MVLHSQLQDGRHTVQLQGVRQAEHSHICGALSEQCLLSFRESKGPVRLKQPHIQGVRWPARRGSTTCAVGFGGASQAVISDGTFTDNDIGSVLRLFGNSSVILEGTRIMRGSGGITAGKTYQNLVPMLGHTQMRPASHAPTTWHVLGSGSLFQSWLMPQLQCCVSDSASLIFCCAACTSIVLTHRGVACLLLVHRKQIQLAADQQHACVH